jgi:uncharacterized membrane protein
MNIEEKILLSIAAGLVTALAFISYNVINNPVPLNELTITCKVEK